MSRHEASPSQAPALSEDAPRRRGRGHDEAGGRRRLRMDSRGEGLYGGGRGGDDASQSRSRSRPGGPPRRRGGDFDDGADVEDQAGDDERQRSFRRRGDSMGGGGRRDSDGASRHASSRRADGRHRSDRDKDKDRRAKEREREYRRLAQQAPMQMAMMQGMMGMPPAMQMAMMGMPGMPAMPGMPPPYMHAMRPPGMMFPSEARNSSKKRRRDTSGGGRGTGPPGDAAGGGAAPSSSSSSSDSSDSESNNGVRMPPAAMAAMASMWAGHPPAAPWAAPGMQHGPMDLEAFLAANPVDSEAADRLRALPPHLQQVVLRRGPVSNTGNPSAVLLARVRDAELGPEGNGPAPTGPAGGPPGPPPGPPPPPPAEEEPKPARKSAKVTIENMIREFRLSAGCAWMLRSLPPDKQKLASRIDPSGQADPSGYVAEQMKLIV